MMFVDYYKILGVMNNASKEDIKKAFRNKVKKHHPDAGGNNEEFILLKKAFDTLFNEFRRARYDEEYDKYVREQATYRKSHEYQSGAHSKNDKYQRENTNNQEQSERYTNSFREAQANSKYNSRQFNIWHLIASASIILNIFLIIVLSTSVGNNESEAVNLVEPDFKYLQAENEKLITQYNEIKERLTNVISDYEKQNAYVVDLEDELKVLKSTPMATAISSNGSTNVTHEGDNTALTISDFFTLGSTKEEVKQVMGTPDSIIGDRWGYDFSSITFEDEFVTGWSDISKNLKVFIINSNSNLDYFTLGSTTQDVVDVMGTPDSIIGDRWGYEFSSVTFEEGIVSGWSDISNNLKVN